MFLSSTQVVIIDSALLRSDHEARRQLSGRRHMFGMKIDRHPQEIPKPPHLQQPIVFAFFRTKLQLDAAGPGIDRSQIDGIIIDLELVLFSYCLEARISEICPVGIDPKIIIYRIGHFVPPIDQRSLNWGDQRSRRRSTRSAMATRPIPLRPRTVIAANISVALSVDSAVTIR